MSTPISADATPSPTSQPVVAADAAAGATAVTAPPRRRRVAQLPWGCIGAWAAALLIPVLLVLAVALPWWQRL
ncbi:MAG: hypothetical protein PVG09_06725, partial [Thiohalocapsa sp.]